MKCTECRHLRRSGNVYICVRTGRTFDSSIAKREQANPCPDFEKKPRRRKKRE